MAFNKNRAIQLLRLGSDLSNANFREGQEDAIRYIVEGLGRLLVVQWPGFAHFALAGVDAQPDRGGGADGRACGHHQLR